MDISAFLKRYPEFKAVDQSLIETTIDDCSLLLAKNEWKELYVQGLCALVAHNLAVKGVLNKDAEGNTAYSNGAGFTTVTSMSASGLSQSFSTGTLPVSSLSDGDLGTTSYGLEFIRLQRMAIVPFVGVR